MEKTLKSYQEDNCRLQLVQIDEHNMTIYKVIENRRIIYKDINKYIAIKMFRNSVVQRINLITIDTL